MSTRSLRYKETFDCTPEVLFDALRTPSSIRIWWGAARVILQAERGGAFAVAWGEDEDDPEYIGTAILSEFDPPRRMVMTDFLYYSKFGPLGFEADFSVEFDVQPNDQGSLLTLDHRGIPTIPEADEYYQGCETGWRTCLANLRAFLERDGQSA